MFPCWKDTTVVATNGCLKQDCFIKWIGDLHSQLMHHCCLWFWQRELLNPMAEGHNWPREQPLMAPMVDFTSKFTSAHELLDFRKISLSSTYIFIKMSLRLLHVFISYICIEDARPVEWTILDTSFMYCVARCDEKGQWRLSCTTRGNGFHIKTYV